MDEVEVARTTLEVIGGAAVALAPVLAVVKKPRIKIEPGEWNAAVPWRFATVWIRNASPPRWLPLASRDAALGVRVTARFYRDGGPMTPPIPCRWSDRPEPLRHELVDPTALGAPPGPPLQIAIPDPALLPQSHVYDLHAGGRREEVAVAVLRDGRASGWGAESYFHDWHHLDWRLDQGIYDVEVRAEWPGTTKTRRFRLEYLSDDLASFRLVEKTR